MTLKQNILPEARRKKLKELLQEGKLVRVMEAHNGLSGIIVNNVTIQGQKDGKPVTLEFDALWESSLTDSSSKGMPDIEIVSFDSRLQTIQEILSVTNKPMIVDGDTGGDPNNFEYLVTKLERLGVSAVIIEDKVFPKRNSLEDGTQQTLENRHLFANKIRRGKSVQATDDFMIIARLESLIAGKSVKNALKRAKCYLEGGADGIMIHSKSKSPDEVLEFAASYKDLCKELGVTKPLVCVPTTYNQITEAELKTHGFNIVIHANHLLRSAYKAMEETAKTILINQRSYEADPNCAPLKDIFGSVGFLDVKQKDQEEQVSKGPAAIIPAAGEEKVLKPYIGTKPKAMVEIGGIPLLTRQLKALQINKLTDVTVIAGYGKDQLEARGATIIENKNYKEGSVLSSLYMAREKMANGFVMLFSDILLEHHTISKLMVCKEDIVLVVDNSFQYHKDANGHPPKDNTGKKVDFVISRNKHVPSRRRISFVYENIISKIGKSINPETATHEFIGLAKFTKTGAENFLETYEDCLKNYKGPFQEAEDVSKISFTDLIQEMIDRGFNINFLEIHKGWLEIHNREDIELANTLFLP